MTASDEKQSTSSQPSQRRIDPNTTYQTAVSLVGLVSQEIYSRFNAMLTIHGFFLAAIALFFNSGRSQLLSHFVIMGVCVAGFSLCFSWLRFVNQGIQAQKFFRNMAVETEKLFGNSVDIFCKLTETKLVEEGEDVREQSTFEQIAKQVILVFRCLYAFLFLLSLFLILIGLIFGEKNWFNIWLDSACLKAADQFFVS